VKAEGSAEGEAEGDVDEADEAEGDGTTVADEAA
jgi:hypothetical protein